MSATTFPPVLTSRKRAELSQLASRLEQKLQSRPELLQRLPDGLKSRNARQEYFASVFRPSPLNLWFIEPLLKGLVEGPPTIDSVVNHPLAPDGSISFPFIMWLVQFRQLEKVFQWKGREEMVSLAIALGANVHVVQKNGVNAAFVAVKYGSVATMDLLAKEGINFQQLDYLGRTILCNTLEYPCPDMLRFVLKHVPATEVITVHTPKGGQIHLSAPDRILQLLLYSEADINKPVSWQIFGIPPVEYVAESLILLRQHGARFTFNTDSRDVWSAVTFAFRKGAAKHLPQAELLKKVTLCLMGLWLPDAVRDQILDGGPTPRGEEGFQAQECPICLDPFESSNATILYCDHCFCRDCIMQYGSTATGEKACPLCRSRLCREITGSTDDVSDPNRRFNLTRESDVVHGPLALSESQIREEAKFQGLRNAVDADYLTLRSKLLEMATSGYNRGATPRPYQMEIDGQSTTHVVNRVLELSASRTFMGSTCLIMAPLYGPAMVDIKTKGIPIIAALSNSSSHTVVSPSLVKLLKLNRIESLQSKKFRDGLSGKKLSRCTITCLDSFPITIGDIEVTISNAVEADHLTTNELGFGIQLGRDFFLSAAWCIVHVPITETQADGSILYMRNDGIGSWETVTKSKPRDDRNLMVVALQVAMVIGCLFILLYRKSYHSLVQYLSGAILMFLGTRMLTGVNMNLLPKTIPTSTKGESRLRYYSRDGRVASVPVLHFNPTSSERMLVFDVTPETPYRECSWCCRIFPEGMLACRECDLVGDGAYYCDKRCQKAAWKIHKRTKKAHTNTRG